MERVNESSGETLWLLTDRELKILHEAAGCVTKETFEDNFNKEFNVSYDEIEKFWFTINDMLREGKPDAQDS